MFSNMKIGMKLSLGFGVIVALSIALGAAAYNNLSGMNAQWQDFKSVTVMRNNAILEGSDALGDAVHSFKDYVLRGGDYDKAFADNIARIDKVVSDYSTAGTATPEQVTLLNQITENAKIYGSAMPKLVALRASGASIQDLDKAVKGADKPISDALEKLTALNQHDVQIKSVQIAELFAIFRTLDCRHGNTHRPSRRIRLVLDYTQHYQAAERSGQDG